jgi:phage terminase large subunit-like protein
LANDQKYNKFKNFFPDEGNFRRELYPKQVSFFNAGATFKERGFIAANRVGKSEAGAYETVCHATGQYPEWWSGLRFKHPPLIWVGGDTATTVRDIIQKKLIGEMNDIGSGMLPKESIADYKTRRNVPEAIEILKIKHLTGGISTIVLKTYEQGRATWQGTEVDFIWVDEECPEDVYGEALIRLMTTKGSIITTFTPLQGVTPLVLSFLDNSQDTEAKYPKWVEICTWDDVPHLTEEEKEKTLANTPPQLRDARSRGVPTVGEGLVYPVDPKHIIVDDFQMPKHFKKLYGMDVGWNNTAALWGAWDVDNDIVYIYSEHKMGQAEPVVHAKAIKARGEWIKGQIDPAARGRSQIDGEQLYMIYRKEGLKVYPANNAVEAGIFNIWERFTTGRLKIFKSCTMLLRELSLYHRDEKGKIVKTNDHLLDCLRYMINAEPSAWSYPQNPSQNKVVNINHYMNACV